MRMRAARVESPGNGFTGLDSTFLDDGWRLHRAGETDKTFDAIVPGDVHSSLVRANIIPDPFRGMNNDKSKWIPNTTWEYENRLEIPRLKEKLLEESKDGGIIHVVFDAIDYDASFFLDDRFTCRQIGMFSPVDIALGASPDENGMDSLVPMRVEFHVQPWWRQHALKCQMAFGWDFAPEIRTVGIWKHVRLHRTGPAIIASARCDLVPRDASYDATHRHVSIHFTITAHFLDPATLASIPGLHDVEINITCAGIDKTIAIKMAHGIPLSINAGETEIVPWEPWSLGEQHQVHARLQIFWKGVLSDEYRAIIANRTVAWGRNPGTLPGDENWTCIVNGKRFFIRGINWVPPSSMFGRLDAVRYQKLVDAAIDMNIDMLRVWGGGIEEKAEFYDYCDQAGMLVWQEFPFACTNYPRDQRYIRIVKQECDGIVQRTAPHPSVVVYCAGNEFNPIINKHVVSICENAVATCAPGIHCFTASPVLGDDHNWKVWGGRRRLDTYELDGEGNYQMLTEFGMQAAPCLETLRECCDRDHISSIDAVRSELGYHKADLAGLLHYAREYNAPITTIESLVKVSQTMQAHAIKRAVEVCRSRWPNVSGVFPWQLSDPWPNVSWSVIDHNLQPKLAARMLRTSYAPVLPMMRDWRATRRGNSWRRGDLVIHNATQDKFDGHVAVEIVHKTAGSRHVTLDTGKIHVLVPPGRPLRVRALEGVVIPGTVIVMRLFSAIGTHEVTNFSFPAMEIPRSRGDKIKDKIDARFDGWWRKHLTRLMESDRLRTDHRDWTAKKASMRE